MYTAEELFRSAVSSPVTLYLASVLFCVSGFHTLFKLVETVKLSSPWIVLFFSCINAGIALAAELLSDGPVNPLAMSAIPAVMVAELMLITKDSKWSYMNYYFAILLDLVCIQGLCSAFSSLGMEELLIIGSDEHRFALFTLTMLAGAALLWGVTHSPAYSAAELAVLLHSYTRGLILFIYMVIAGIVMQLSALFTLKLVYDAGLDPDIRRLVYSDLALKDGLILLCSFLIIMIQIRQDRNLQRSLILDSDLQKERGFRTSSQKEAMLCYCANITKNQLEEGREYFSEALCGKEEGYLETLKQFAIQCVHKEDWSKLFNIGNPNYYQEKLETNPSYNLRLRVSPEQMLKYTRLPAGAEEKLLEAEKEYIWVEFHATVTQDAVSGEIRAYISLMDIDNMVAKEDALYRAANVDVLTNVFNRAALEDFIREYMMQKDSVGVMFMIDMDHFKEVNDSMGHPAGDRLLKETAAMLRSVFRDRDVVGRMGGDEFCVFAPGLRSREVMEQRATEMNERGWRVHAKPDGGQIQTSLSIGIACTPGDGDTYEALYKSADAALYCAKRDGRNTYRVFTPEMLASEEAGGETKMEDIMP